MRSMLSEGGKLRPNARTLWEIQAKALRPPVETASNLYTFIRARAEEAARLGEKERASVRDREGLQAYQAKLRRLLFSCLGGLPPETGARPGRVIGRTEYPEFLLERVLLYPGQGRRATAAAYAPRTAGPHPAALVLIGHTDAGKADGEYQYLAQLLAHAGFVALALDPFGEGERFEHYESGAALQPIQGCSGEHDLMAWKCALMGESLARYFIRDGIAALDYLASRPDVDPSRIALTGHSGGGAQTCLMMAAAGERFACAAPCAYVTDNQAMLENGVDPDDEMIWPGSAAFGIDYADLLAGMAGKPLLILSPRQDFFPREGAERTLRRVRALWTAAGAGALPEIYAADTGHAYSPALAQAAADFFSRNLLGRPADLNAFQYRPLSEKELSCFPDQPLLTAEPDMRTLQDVLCDTLRAMEKQRKDEPEARLAQLSGAVHSSRAHAGEPRVYGEGICGHYAWRAVVWRPEKGRWGNGVFLRDMRQSGPLPTAIALWPGGLSRLAEHSPWIHRAVRAGWQVFAMDVTADGSLLPAELGASGMYIGWGTMYTLNAYLLQLGDSLCALRTRDVLAAVDLIRAWPEAETERICLYARGDMTRCAEAAALINNVPVCFDPLVQPYEDIVRDKYHDQTHTFAWALPGLLRFCDTASLRDDLARRRLAAADMAFASPDRVVFPSATSTEEERI